MPILSATQAYTPVSACCVVTSIQIATAGTREGRYMRCLKRELVCSRGCHGRNNETDLGAARIRPRRSLGSTAPHRAEAPRVTWFCSVAAIQDPRIRNRIPRWCSSDRGRVRGTKSSNSAARSRGRARRCPFASRMKRCNAPVQGIWERDRQANDRARRQPIGNGRPSTPRSPRAKLDGIV